MEVFTDPAHAIAVAHAANLQIGAWCPQAVEEAALIDAGIDCLVVDDWPAAVTRASRAGAPGSPPPA